MKRILFSSLVLVACLLVAPSPASAGGCPGCESSEDCPGGFCVYWDEGHGCQDVNPICCPGQGCNVDPADGRPSCEAEGTCCVVGDPGCGVGGSTTASGSESASSESTASGTAASEASATATATATDTDSGSGSGDGCGCGSNIEGSMLAMLLFALPLARRRR